jgi:hypothetical protein
MTEGPSTVVAQQPIRQNCRIPGKKDPYRGHKTKSGDASRKKGREEQKGLHPLTSGTAGKEQR